MNSDLKENQPNKNTPFPPNICPICGKVPAEIGRNFRGDSVCENGHCWHTCLVHMKIVTGKSDLNQPPIECTCLNKKQTEDKYMYETIEEYEKIVGFKVTEASRMAWNLARMKE